MKLTKNFVDQNQTAATLKQNDKSQNNPIHNPFWLFFYREKVEADYQVTTTLIGIIMMIMFRTLFLKVLLIFSLWFWSQEGEIMKNFEEKKVHKEIGKIKGTGKNEEEMIGHPTEIGTQRCWYNC